MKTKTAVNRAFRLACRNARTHYTPHSAKHSIAAERDRWHLTALESKAWSENMGHDTEQITDRHYAKLSSEGRRQAMEGVGNGSKNSDFIEFLKSEEFLFDLSALLEHHVAGGRRK